MSSNPHDPPLAAASDALSWRPAGADDLRAVPGEVLVLCVGLDLPGRDVAALREVLVAEETARADRFHRPIDRDRFVVRRGRLREVLARMLEVEPGQVALRVGARGKPALATSGVDLRFNVSHSAGWALLAFTLGGELGVDLEWMRPAPDALELAERFFSRGESAYLAACAPDRVEPAFFSLWTRKEAVVKCVGAGLHLGLDGFELAPEPVPQGERVDVEAAPNGALWVYPLPPSVPQAVAAVACEAPRARLRCLTLPGAGR